MRKEVSTVLDTATMSQNSPSKCKRNLVAHASTTMTDTTPDERIERHLMRQRGAGTRTVNADFGFSFAGFSAPASQEATPMTLPAEPPAKRRKTIAEYVDAEPELTRATALDRRGKTKVGRAKRTFLADVGERPTKRKRTDDLGADDSFVGIAGVKRRKANNKAGTESAVQGAVTICDGDSAEIERTDAAATKAATKKKRQQKGIAAGAVSSGLRETIELNEPTNVEKTKKSRAAKCTKKAALQMEGSDRDEQLEEAPTTASKPSKPKPRKQASRNAARNAPSPQKEITEPEPLSVDANSKARKGTGKRLKGTKSRKPKQPANMAEDVLDPMPESVDVQESTEPSEPKAQPSKQPTRLSRKTKALAVSNDDGEEGKGTARSRERKHPRATTRSSLSDKRKLSRTPPQLERRPLQEADANRSPSPRKLARESMEKLDEPGRSVEKGGSCGQQTQESANRIASKDHGQGRRLRVKRDVTRDASDTGTAKDEDDAGLSANARSNVGSNADASYGTSTSAKDSSQAKTSKNARGGGLEPRPAREKGRTVDKEEDIDWLFAAPARQPRIASATASGSKPSSTNPRKPRLADIDLDDLLANVAAFAQSDRVARTNSR